MSASKCGHRAAERGEIGLETALQSLKSRHVKSSASTHAAAGVMQIFLSHWISQLIQHKEPFCIYALNPVLQ